MQRHDGDLMNIMTMFDAHVRAGLFYLFINRRFADETSWRVNKAGWVQFLFRFTAETVGDGVGVSRFKSVRR